MPDEQSTFDLISKPGELAESEEDVEARLAMEGLVRHRKARRRKKIIAACVVAGALAVGGIGWGVSRLMSSQQVEEVTLQTMTLMRSDFTDSVSATGKAEPLSQVVVTPEVAGIIESVNVAEGQSVGAGDVLLTIKNDELDKAVREAEIAVRSANADLTSARSAYNTTYNAYAKGPTYGDDGEVVDAGTPWSDVEKAQTAIDSAKLALETAQGTYNDAVEKAGKRTVTAPSAGSVVVMNAQVGAEIGSSAGSGSSSLVTIADLSQMKVKVQVNEVDISEVSVGQKARVSFSALEGAQLEAEVTRISTVASSGDSDGYSSSYGVVTYDVELLIPEPSSDLKPGMSATVEILQQDVPDALTVPASALMAATSDPEQYTVYVLTDAETQACEARTVTVVAQNDAMAAIEGDVEEGDEVVLDPYLVENYAAADDAGEATSMSTEGDAGAEGDAGSTEQVDGSAEGDAVVEGDDAADADAATEPATDDAAA